MFGRILKNYFLLGEPNIFVLMFFIDIFQQVFQSIFEMAIDRPNSVDEILLLSDKDFGPDQMLLSKEQFTKVLSGIEQDKKMLSPKKNTTESHSADLGSWADLIRYHTVGNAFLILKKS